MREIKITVKNLSPKDKIKMLKENGYSVYSASVDKQNQKYFLIKDTEIVSVSDNIDYFMEHIPFSYFVSYLLEDQDKDLCGDIIVVITSMLKNIYISISNLLKQQEIIIYVQEE